MFKFQPVTISPKSHHRTSLVGLLAVTVLRQDGTYATVNSPQAAFTSSDYAGITITGPRGTGTTEYRTQGIVSYIDENGVSFDMP